MSVHSSPRAEQESAVWSAMQAYVKDHTRESTLQRAVGLGPGVGLIKVLQLLRAGPRSLVEIADAKGIDAGYATVLADKLESRGLLQRKPHPDDRRRKLVALTPAGMEILDRVDAILAEPPPGFARLSPDDLDDLRRLFDRLT